MIGDTLTLIVASDRSGLKQLEEALGNFVTYIKGLDSVLSGTRKPVKDLGDDFSSAAESAGRLQKVVNGLSHAIEDTGEETIKLTRNLQSFALAVEKDFQKAAIAVEKYEKRVTKANAAIQKLSAEQRATWGGVLAKQGLTSAYESEFRKQVQLRTELLALNDVTLETMRQETLELAKQLHAEGKITREQLKRYELHTRSGQEAEQLRKQLNTQIQYEKQLAQARKARAVAEAEQLRKQLNTQIQYEQQLEQTSKKRAAAEAERLRKQLNTQIQLERKLEQSRKARAAAEAEQLRKQLNTQIQLERQLAEARKRAELAQVGALPADRREQLRITEAEEIARRRIQAEFRKQAELQAILNTDHQKQLTLLHRETVELARQAYLAGKISKEEFRSYELSAQRVRRELVLSTLQLSRMRSMIRGISGALGGLWMTYGRSLVALTAGFAAASAAAKGLKEAASFEYATKYMETLARRTGDTSMSLAEIRKQLLAVRDTVYSPTELAQAAKELVKQGFTLRQAISEIGVVAQFAANAEEDLAEVTKIVASQYRAWHESLIGPERGVRSLTEVANALGVAVAKTALSVSSLKIQLKHMSELAKTTGLKFTEAIAAMGALTNVGVTGSKAATALRTGLLRLAAPTDDVKNLFRDLEIEFSAFDKMGRQKTAVRLFEDFAKAIEKVDEKSQALAYRKIFGMRAMAFGANIGTMLRQGYVDLVKQIDELTIKGQFVNTVFQDVNVTLQRQVALLQADYKRALTEAFESPEFTEFIRELRRSIADGALKDFVVLLSDAVKTLVKFRDVIYSVAKAFLSYKVARLFVTTLEGIGKAALAAKGALRALIVEARGLPFALSSLGGPATLATIGTTAALWALWEQRSKEQERRSRPLRKITGTRVWPWEPDLLSDSQFDLQTAHLSGLQSAHERADIGAAPGWSDRPLALSDQVKLAPVRGAADTFSAELAKSAEAARKVAEQRAKARAEFVELQLGAYEGVTSLEEAQVRYTQLLRDSILPYQQKENELRLRASYAIDSQREAYERLAREQRGLRLEAEIRLLDDYKKIIEGLPIENDAEAEKRRARMLKNIEYQRKVRQNQLELLRLEDRLRKPEKPIKVDTQALTSYQKQTEQLRLQLQYYGRPRDLQLSQDRLAARQLVDQMMQGKDPADLDYLAKLQEARRKARQVFDTRADVRRRLWAKQDAEAVKQETQALDDQLRLLNKQYELRTLSSDEAWKQLSLEQNRIKAEALLRRLEKDGVENAKELSEETRKLLDKITDAQERLRHVALSDAAGEGAKRYFESIGTAGDAVAKQVERAFQSLEDTLTNVFMTGKLNAENFFNVVKRGLVEIFVQKKMMPMFKGIISGAFDVFAGLLHTGGIVGATPVPMRMVPAHAFIGAPRYHSGLYPDEFPAILQKGEIVIQKGGWKTGSVAPTVNVKVVNKATGAQVSEPYTANGGRDLIIEIEDALAPRVASGRGRLAQAIKVLGSNQNLAGRGF